MPEGDTLARTSATMHRWLAGREITAATTRVDGFPADRLVGRTIEGVDAWGKNLMIRLDGGQVLHTHLRMTGSWHVYPAGQPVAAARAPGPTHPHLRRPGGGVLQRPRRRAPPPRRRAPPPVPRQPRPRRAPRGHRPRRGPPPGPGRSPRPSPRRAPPRPAGGGGHRQHLAGESLFVEGHNPWTPLSAITDDQLDALVATAGRLMRPAVESRTGVPTKVAVYRRAGQPCRGAAHRSAPSARASRPAPPTGAPPASRHRVPPPSPR